MPTKEGFPCCQSQMKGWNCTKKEGHSGKHVATSMDGRVYAKWGAAKKPTKKEALSMLAELVAVLDTSREHNDDYSFHEPLSVREACDRARNFL